MEGLIQVYTGEGKGKTTAALGLALRAAGHGQRVLMIQFAKERATGEELYVAQQHPFELVKLGKGPTSTRKAWALAQEALSSGQYFMVILDEVFTAIKRGWITLEQVLEIMTKKQPHTELVLTGRDAPQEIIQKADLVTEMHLVKHPFKKGIRARKGIEY